jgi:Fe-S cluster assembly ATP-binding protein
MLEIKNLHASIDDKEILKGVDLNVKAGEVHAIMGPNGSGKSTLAKALAGDEQIKVTQGQILYQGKDLLNLSVEERALQGVFMAFQYPVEIPGVNNASFLRMAYNSRLKAIGKEELDPLAFNRLLKEKLKLVEMDPQYIARSLNHGFSGGEKKRNEILQMAVLEPTLSILDETDSGLDIDALRVVAKGVERLKRKDNAIILITHYQRLLNYIQPDHVHIITEGRITRSGDKTLAHELEEKGYRWLHPAKVSK